jgi:hypothetical protein
MDRFDCTKQELAKTLTNSTPVTLLLPLGGTTQIRVYLLSTGEYVGAFERPPTKHALPPLECAAVSSAEPPTAPALVEPPPAPALAEPPTAPALAEPPTAPALAEPPTAPALAEPPTAPALAETPTAPALAEPPTAPALAETPTDPALPAASPIGFWPPARSWPHPATSSPNQELHAPPQPPQRFCNHQGCSTPLNQCGALAARIAAKGHPSQRYCAQHNFPSRQRDAAPRAQEGAAAREDNPRNTANGPTRRAATAAAPREHGRRAV